MKRMFAILGYILLIGLLAGCSDILPNTIQNQSKPKVIEEDSSKTFDTFFYVKQAAESENLCVVSDNKFPPMVSSNKKYIYDIAYDMHDKYYFYKGFNRIRTVLKECRIRVYDIKNLEILYDINLKNLLESYLEDYELIGNTLQNGIKEGKQVIIFELQKKQTEEEMASGIEAEEVKFWLDFEAGEVHLLDPEDNVEIIEYAYDSENLWMLLGTEILPEGTFTDNYSWIENSSYIQIAANKLPEYNKKLYNMFSELKDVKREEGVYVYLFLFPKTDNMEVLSLILDDYEDLDFSKINTDSNGFYGMYKAKNGKGHRISESEYKQFQKEYRKYREEQRDEYGIKISRIPLLGTYRLWIEE